MTFCVITEEFVRQSIDLEWINCRWFLIEIAKDKGTDVETLMNGLGIYKPDLTGVIFHCKEVFDNDWEWAGEEGTMRAFSAIVAARILEHLENSFRRNSNGSKKAREL